MNVEQDPDRLESFAKFPLFHEKHRKNHRKVISKTSVGQKHNIQKLGGKLKISLPLKIIIRFWMTLGKWNCVRFQNIFEIFSHSHTIKIVDKDYISKFTGTRKT